MSDDVAFLEATAQAELVRQRKASPRELVDAAIARIERVNPKLNAVIIQRFEKARAEAAAPAVAAGLVPVAHANDGGGSIRIPSSECGLVVLKPSRGRTSLGRDVGEGWGGLSVEHVVARSVRDTAAVLDAVAGYLPGDPYTAPPPARPFRDEVGAAPGKLRVGLLVKAPAGQAEVHPECATAARETARL